MGVLTTCTNEIKTNFTKFQVSVCGDYEEWRLRGYDAVWPGINLLKCRGKVLHPYHTPEISVDFYYIARSHITADFNISNLSVVFIWFLVNLWLPVTLNIPSLARQRCLSSWGPRRTPWFFFVISQLFDAVDYSNYVFWVSETIIQWFKHC